MKSWFKGKKQKTEKIVIEVPEIPITIRDVKTNDNDMYMEIPSNDNNRYSLDDCGSIAEKIDKVQKRMEFFSKKLEELLHKYHFLQVFSWVVLDQERFKESIRPLDKSTNDLKKHFQSLRENWKTFSSRTDLEEEELVDRHIEIQDLFEVQKDLMMRVNGIEKQYYPNMKMSSYSICNDKTSNELQVLHRNILEMVRNYKNIHETYDHIFYNSGELIVKTVELFVECFQKSNNSTYQETYKFHYFLDTSYILTFPYAEWVNLFNKLRYVMRTTNNIELYDYLTFQTCYQELEKRYLIVLIFHEMMGQMKERGKI